MTVIVDHGPLPLLSCWRRASSQGLWLVAVARRGREGELLVLRRVAAGARVPVCLCTCAAPCPCPLFLPLLLFLVVLPGVFWNWRCRWCCPCVNAAGCNEERGMAYDDYDSGHSPLVPGRLELVLAYCIGLLL